MKRVQRTLRLPGGRVVENHFEGQHDQKSHGGGGGEKSSGGDKATKYSGTLTKESGKALMQDVQAELAKAGLPRESPYAGGELTGLIDKGTFGSTGFSVADMGDTLRFNVVVSGKKAGLRYKEVQKVDSQGDQINLKEPINPEQLNGRISNTFAKMGFKVQSVRMSGFQTMWDDDIDYTIITKKSKAKGG